MLGSAPCVGCHSIKDEGFFDFVDPETHMLLNVGGQVFEATAGLLTRDKHSILAALCRRDKPPLTKTKAGHIFLDRDW